MVLFKLISSFFQFEHLPLPETPTLMSVSPPILGSSMTPMTLQPTLLGPGEIIKTSGKFPKPTKIPGKNYWKDEVVIRNSDSGKGNFLIQTTVVLI